MNSADVIEIRDIDDPRVADYRDIRDRDLRGRDGRPGLFVAEQALVVELMLSLPGVAKSVLIGPTWVRRIAPQAPDGVPVYVARPQILARVVGFDIHRGILGVGRRDEIERATVPVPPPPHPATLLAIEDVSNIDNIGFLFRNAAAFGADGVLLSPRCHDPLYRKSLRVSIGHALTVPFARSTAWHDDLLALKGAGVTLIAAALGERSRDLDAIEPPRRVALVVGAEHAGLDTSTLDLCDHVARVPMAPGVDSLNVAVAAAICLHRFTNAHRT